MLKLHKKKKGVKGGRGNGRVPTHLGKVVIVRPVKSHQWEAPRILAPPSKPPSAITPPKNSYFEPSPAITPQAGRPAIAVYFLETPNPVNKVSETVRWILKHLGILNGFEITPGRR